MRELGSELIVRLGKPEDVLPQIIDEIEAEQLLFHGEVAPEESKVEKYVDESLSVSKKRYWGHAMYHRDDLPFNLLTIPDVYTQFRKKVEKKCTVRSPVSAPDRLTWGKTVDPGNMTRKGSMVGDGFPN